MLLHRSRVAAASTWGRAPAARLSGLTTFYVHSTSQPCRLTQQPQRSASISQCELVPRATSGRIPSYTQLHRESTFCRSTVNPEPIPDDLSLELDPDETAKEVTYDETSKTVRIPLAALNDGKRRTKMVMFTCNQCGGRSARLVNPVAWERGAVFCQCQHCGVWHTLAAAPHIIEEIRYNDPDWQGPGSSKAAAAGSSDGSGSQHSSDTMLGQAAPHEEQEVTSAAPAGVHHQQQDSR